QGARPVAQHLGERISERPWLNQLDHVSIGHGVSLLCWRSGGANTPTIRRLLPVSPSPTSAHSSRTAEQRDEQQPPGWSGERYVHSHWIFAADAGAHDGRITTGSAAAGIG